MPNDSPCPISLTIAGLRLDLRVAGFSGQDALNEPWYFAIDLISRDPFLDIATLQGRQACFKPTAGHCGIDGEVIAACQVYAGTCLSHYQVILRPRLQRLAQTPRQRLFSDQSSLQLIEQLLTENGFGTADVRFEHLHGIYPPRKQCVQYQESDLHLLQRLCEEEGIHFHFDGPQLVFCDDPAGFSERPEPLLVNLPPHPCGLLDHLSEALRLRAVTPVARHPAQSADAYHPPQHAQAPGWQLQRRNRDLERLRSGARQINGHSRDATLRSGQIIRIKGHPEQRYNDHWLVTRVQHYGRQTGVFEGHDPHDIAIIVRNLSREQNDDRRFSAPTAALSNGEQTQYHNRFEAMPWTQPFRPAIEHPKPRITGLHAATLCASHDKQPQGWLSLRLDWQTADSAPAQAQLIPGRLPADTPLIPGNRVLVAYVDSDPDRPSICALLSGNADNSPTGMSLEGRPIDPATESLPVPAGEHLQISARDTLTLQGPMARIRIDRDGIEVSAPRLQLTQRSTLPALQDLHLAAHGAPLGDCVWYIVRMQEPGLENLSQLDPEHVLFEGRTDDQGYLGMTVDQLQQLAVEYANDARTLCLLHPGHCVTLRQYLRQSSNDAQHLALLDTAAKQKQR